MKPIDFEALFKEDKETIADLKISKKDFKRILNVFVEGNPATKTIGDVNKQIQDLKLDKPIETVLFICFNSLKKSYEDSINNIVYKNPDIVKDIINGILKELPTTLFRLFYLMRSPENLDKQTVLITFLFVLNILGFSNICNKADLVKFASAICKKNNYNIEDILMGTFNSFYVYSLEGSPSNESQNANTYH